MPTRRVCRPIAVAVLASIIGALSAAAKTPDDLAGIWTLSSAKLGTKCRLLLRAEKSDKGDYFLGMPPACRHAMPETAAIGRWGAPDGAHVTLDDPAGTVVLGFSGANDSFTANGTDGTYTLTRSETAGRSAAGFAVVDAKPSETLVPVPIAVTKRTKSLEVDKEAIDDLPGRYAVMRAKRDTGCMLTLDKSRTKGADRAQLAPGCRDQGIVIFDPSAWQVVKGELVLTARAGHKAKLEKQSDGSWTKDPKDGGKPLGLKKL